MVKTHPDSRFTLKSLNDIRNSTDVVLQILETESTFKGSNETCYLCEVVSQQTYNSTTSITKLTDEIIRLNADIRRWQTKFEKLEKAFIKANPA